GIRDRNVTGVQTCALPIWLRATRRGCGCSWVGRFLWIAVEFVHRSFQIAAREEHERINSSLDSAFDQRHLLDGEIVEDIVAKPRSEERRVGKECREVGRRG